ncbi:hypothetical protein DOE63_04095 [Salmonella enterica subsp. diarizonae serovar 59:z10:-]|nr:hypothetical protein DOE63_04095 [Salmonella enterica subsp. diarizonae serovar 59:z10:-]
MTTMSRTDYAKHAGVDRKTITRWIKAKKFIVLSGDDVNVEASDKALAIWRNSKDGRLTNAVRGKRETANAETQTEDGEDEKHMSKVVEEIMKASGATMTKEEASRVKENYLALLTKLEYQQKEGELVDLTEAKEVLFTCARQSRDAWMNWPARVAPLMAADLDISADRMTEVLTEHVHKHISLLGEPEFYITEE